jgi:hypothetical protein
MGLGKRPDSHKLGHAVEWNVDLRTFATDLLLDFPATAPAHALVKSAGTFVGLRNAIPPR